MFFNSLFLSFPDLCFNRFKWSVLYLLFRHKFIPALNLTFFRRKLILLTSIIQIRLRTHSILLKLLFLYPTTIKLFQFFFKILQDNGVEFELRIISILLQKFSFEILFPFTHHWFIRSINLFI